MKQAGRALQLAGDLFGDTPENDFLDVLAKVESNTPAIGSGKDIYEREVRPLGADLKKAAAHFAMSSFFEDYAKETDIFSFKVTAADRQKFGDGRLRLAAGDVTASSMVTLEQERLYFAAMLWGDHELHAGVAPYTNKVDYQNLAAELKALSGHVDCADCLKFLDRRFPGSVYDLGSLFSDERGKIIDHIIAGTLFEVEAAHRDLYRRHHATMRFLASLGQSTPPHFIASAAALQGQRTFPQLVAGAKSLFRHAGGRLYQSAQAGRV